MKKQILFTTVIVTVILSSCTKEDRTMQITSPSAQDQTAQAVSSRNRATPDIVSNLEGWFPLNGNLKDSANKLADGVPSKRVFSYAYDRKGKFKSAIYIDSTFFVKIKAVPQQIPTSLSVWFQPVSFDYNMAGAVVSTDYMGPKVLQSGFNALGIVATSTNSPGEYVAIPNMNWHHAVVTYDGKYVKFYLDNVLKYTLRHSGPIPPTQSDYYIGWSSVWPHWNGWVDDIRFYSRALSATDVDALYHE